MKINRLILGLIVIVLGFLLLLDVTDAFDLGWIISYAWPLLLTFLGLNFLLKRNGQYMLGTFFLLWGLLEFGKRLGVGFLRNVSVWNMLWPIVIILFGLWILFSRKKESSDFSEMNPFKERERVSGEDRLDASAFFSGINVLHESSSFEGGHVTAAFGGAEISLKNATVPVGETAVVDVLCAFGGVEIHVPEDWKVQVKVLPFFGGVDNKTSLSKDNTQDVKLIIKGTVAFGGVEINNK